MMNDCGDQLENETTLCCNEKFENCDTKSVILENSDTNKSVTFEHCLKKEEHKENENAWEEISTPKHGGDMIENSSPGKTKNDKIFEENCLELNKNERVAELENIVYQQQRKNDENEMKIKQLENKCLHVEQIGADLENRLHIAIRQYEAAIKEKEAMVMRYAVSEKGVLEQKAGREIAERKLLEMTKEKDLLQHKLNGMVSEKARICQMLDNKCYEMKGVQQELDRTKSDLSALETKLKWSQNSLRTEIELHKESSTKVEQLTVKLQEATNEIEKVKREAQESIRSFHQSQENRAYVLDQQLKEQHATLILEKHEREEREIQVHNLKSELDKLQRKHQILIEENNALSVKVQQLERERLENEQKLSELRNCADKLRHDEANMNSLTAAVEQLKLQLSHEQEQREASSQQVTFLKQRNSELETDMDACRVREADMLLFTQQLTDKNVRLQSEFSALETKVQQLTCEQTLLKRSIKEQETRSNLLVEQLEKERSLRSEESQVLARHLAEKTKLCEQLAQQLEDQKGENLVMKRKLELSVKEVTKELQQCRRKLEQYEKAENSTNSRSSSSSSLNVTEAPSTSPSPVNLSSVPDSVDHRIIQPDNVLDRQVLIDHIIKLQRASAKKSEKLDFLEEHVQTLVMELQRKSRLLQSYMMREQTGALSSNKMDDNKGSKLRFRGCYMQTSVSEKKLQQCRRKLKQYEKAENSTNSRSSSSSSLNVTEASSTSPSPVNLNSVPDSVDHRAELAKSHGIMASVYGSKIVDNNLTLELSLDINRKLQAVLEDTLLKNITLKENVDTLGAEIERLNKLIK